MRDFMIRLVDTKKLPKDEKILNLLRPYVKEWFKKNFKEFTLPQKFAIPLIHKKKNVLVTAPTGSGKTLSAFLAILNELFRLAERNRLENKIYCIYVSPLRALDNDIHRNLEIPLKEIPKIAEKKFKIKLEEVRVGIRTGDTLPSEKQKQLRKPPHILITTPETLAILLGTRKFKENLKDVKWVIVDEIHELANSKRGIHLSLSLERLQHFVGKEFVRIGLGATLEPLEEAAKFLVGLKKGKFRSCYIIDARFVKPIDIKVLVPSKNLIFESAEQINRKMYNLLDRLISKHRTTLVFTNTRSGAERVHFHLKQLFPSKYLDEFTGVHHSSVSREIRFEVEEKMKKGELRCAISSSSLELGIDIGYIDLVVQIGSPKSVSRLMQRCLPYDAEVLLSDGSYMKIGEIVERSKKVELLSFHRGRLEPVRIVKYHKNFDDELLRIKFSCGEEILVTKEHPLLTKNGWKEAKDIAINDEIVEIGYFNVKDSFSFFDLLLEFKDKIYVRGLNKLFIEKTNELKEELGSLKEVAKKFTDTPVWIKGLGFCNGRHYLGEKDLIDVEALKIAAQAAHGSISSFLKAREMGKEDWINKWIREGQKKIVLKVSGEKELLKLYEKANRRKLPAVLIRDAGLTQIEEGTLTVLAIGPAPCREIDEITGELKLL